MNLCLSDFCLEVIFTGAIEAAFYVTSLRDQFLLSFSALSVPVEDRTLTMRFHTWKAR